MSFFRSLFGGSGWNSIPPAVKDDLEQRLGEQRFNGFTRICETHDVFPQMSSMLKKVDHPELMDLMFATFLTSVGNALGQQGIMRQDRSFLKDAVEVFTVALDIKPDHFPIRMGLIAAYVAMGNKAEAQSTAKRALEDIEAAVENGRSSLDDELQEMRSEFQKIAEGKLT